MNIQDTNYIPEVLQELENLMKYTVQVGVLQGVSEDKYPDIDVLTLARIHEYGIDIEVTEKMRAYLHYQGLHLNPDTTHIKIPERSFLRSGFDNRVKQVEDKLEWLVDEVINLNITAYDMYNALGAELTGLIQQYLTDLSDPRNHPFTIQQKGSSNPLITASGGGRLRQAITWQVVTR